VFIRVDLWPIFLFPEKDMTPFKRLTSALILCLVVSVALLPRPLVAQQSTAPKPAASAVDYSASLAAIEKTLDEKRKEFGIPGLSLVIVKDDKVIYLKGLGVKDLERKLPVTPDTRFAIGSSSKAFTAMLAVMSADDGKLSLDDSPKKFLPYFTLRDQDAAAKVTIRDLLAHRSGLNRTDLAMVTGVLNREELIKVAGMAKPTAKLGEKFQYQNVMYAAAGEAVSKAQNSTWDKLIATRIFKPLGMTNSDTTAEDMQKSRDHSLGYDYNASTKVTRQLPQRAIPAAAPAGAINSSARDMAQWVRLMLANGTFNGRRLVSEKGFDELVRKQVSIGGTVDYGLGWFLRQWNGHKVVEHGGNIDGFNAQVALMPDQKLGFVLLTNVTASPLGGIAMNTIWKNLVGEPKASEAKSSEPAADPKKEVGKYLLAAAGVNFEVTWKDDKLMLTVPGQPNYPLENIGGRRYKLGDPAPAGFFATFRPVKDKENETELFVEQPQGNIVLKKVVTDSAPAAVGAAADVPADTPLRDLIASYEGESAKVVIEIAYKDGKVSLVVPGQSPYPLNETEKNKLRSPSLPDTYWVDVNRDAAGAVSGIVLNQPEGRFSFKRLASTPSLINVDDLLAKMIVAYGGEENLRKHKSSITTVEVDLENQGVQGTGSISARAPNLAASDMIFMALGKKIGTIASYFDGNTGGEVMSFAPEETYSGKRLEDIKAGADFYDVLNWKSNYKTIAVKRMGKVGEEEVYVVEKRSEKGTPVTDYISTKTFLLLRRDSLIVSDTTGIELPLTQSFSDYRKVDGVMIPFTSVSNNLANGDIVVHVKDVKFDVEIPDSVFRKPSHR
jgi:CubicO group peptidase (beta-lactamase class C family)